jgi:hypothetical protein
LTTEEDLRFVEEDTGIEEATNVRICRLAAVKEVLKC